MPAVPIDEPAPAGNGIVARVTKVEAIESTASGPGQIAGPAVRITLSIDNGSNQSLALDGVVVNMYLGAERSPALPLDDPTQMPFAGTVEPSASAAGVYVFSVPEDSRDSVVIELGYQPGAPLLLFTGPVE
jgi:hypothetical protein